MGAFHRVVILSVLVACETAGPRAAAPTPTPRQEPEPVAPAGKAADGDACTTDADCASGRCWGEGCGPREGRCVSATLGCTEDYVAMCDCAGQTFHGSSSCPGTRIAHRGACQDAAPAEPAEPAKPAKPAKPKPTAALDICTADGDCEVYFRLHACFPGEPLAINKARRADARARHPLRRIECAMGGPDYQCRAESARNRYTTTCKAGRCTLVDRGEKPCGPGITTTP